MPSALSSVFGGGSSQVGGGAAAASNVGINKQIAELRRQFDVTQGNITPFLEAGTEQLAPLTQGTTAAGLDERLAQIFGTDAFGALRDERTRAIEGQLAAGGLTRSGTAIQEAANIPASLGLALEEMLTGRSSNLAGTGLGAATGLGQFGAQTSSAIGQALAQQGKNISSGILTDQQARAAGGENLVNLATTAAGIFFSDPVLKENVEQISSINDLAVYQWDWVPETKGTMIEKCGTIGFMADEVREKYPHHVKNYCGLMTIDYPSLLSELEEMGSC